LGTKIWFNKKKHTTTKIHFSAPPPKNKTTCRMISVRRPSHFWVANDLTHTHTHPGSEASLQMFHETTIKHD